MISVQKIQRAINASICKIRMVTILITWIGLLTTALAYAQETGIRPRSAVYPLDGVQLPDKSIVIVDRNLPGIWKYDYERLSLFVQGNKQFRQPLNAVRCIAVSTAGVIYVGDSATREVYEIQSGSEPKPLTGGAIGVPVDLALSSDGRIFVADLERRAVWSWLLASDEVPKVLYPKANPRGLAVDTQDRLWVLSQNSEQLVRYEKDGSETTVVKERTFEFAHNIMVDPDDVAWVSDGYAKAVWKIAPNAAAEKAITSELFQNPVGLFPADGKIAIVDSHAAAVFLADRDGSVTEWFKIADGTKP